MIIGTHKSNYSDSVLPFNSQRIWVNYKLAQPSSDVWWTNVIVPNRKNHSNNEYAKNSLLSRDNCLRHCNCGQMVNHFASHLKNIYTLLYSLLDCFRADDFQAFKLNNFHPRDTYLSSYSFLSWKQGSFNSTGLVVSSKLPRFSDMYTLTIASADPKSISANKPVVLTKSVTKWLVFFLCYLCYLLQTSLFSVISWFMLMKCEC